MPYFPILQKPTQNNLITKTSFRQDAPIGAMHRHREKTAEERIAPSAQYIAIGEKTAEERFNMLARGWLAYPVTPMHALLPPKSGCRNVTLRLHSLVAERRHSSVTRYAKRSVACRDSPRQQPLRAGGTPLPRHPSYCASTSSAIHRFAPSSQYTAIGEKPPKSGLIR